MSDKHRGGENNTNDLFGREKMKEGSGRYSIIRLGQFKDHIGIKPIKIGLKIGTRKFGISVKGIIGLVRWNRLTVNKL